MHNINIVRSRGISVSTEWYGLDK